MEASVATTVVSVELTTLRATPLKVTVGNVAPKYCPEMLIWLVT
jgi:hypothetical protein